MVTHPVDAQRRMAVCAIFKDETRNLREWIEFHRVVGVERFFLYDNNDTPHSDWHEVLDPYFDEGILQVTHWPGRAVQLSAYHHALMSWGRTVRWMAFLDLDEFLFCPGEYLVPEVLYGYPGVGAVGVCWAVYGTSGVAQRTDELVTETFQWRATDVGLSQHVKSIVRTARAVDAVPMDPHHFPVDGRSVDTLLRTLDGPFAVSPTYEHLRINHYISKSVAEATEKMLRPRADNGELREMDLLAPSLNAIHDPAITRWLPALKKRMAAYV